MKKLLTTACIACIMGAGLASCNGNAASAEAQKSDSGSNAAGVVIENIMTRKSIRQFTDQPVAKDTLDLLVKAGMAAPSARNAQPWAFVVVDEKAMLDSLNAVHEHANLKTATAAIIVCGDTKVAADKEIGEFWVQDCSAATENILLAAHGCGLGAVWCGVYPVEERVKAVSGVLGLPENVVPLNIITLGWPDENPEVKDKYDKAKIHYNKW